MVSIFLNEKEPNIATLLLSKMHTLINRVIGQVLKVKDAVTTTCGGTGSAKRGGISREECRISQSLNNSLGDFMWRAEIPKEQFDRQSSSWKVLTPTFYLSNRQVSREREHSCKQVEKLRDSSVHQGEKTHDSICHFRCFLKSARQSRRKQQIVVKQLRKFSEIEFFEFARLFLRIVWVNITSISRLPCSNQTAKKPVKNNWKEVLACENTCLHRNSPVPSVYLAR